jgi:hypothetical protein
MAQLFRFSCIGLAAVALAASAGCAPKSQTGSASAAAPGAAQSSQAAAQASPAPADPQNLLIGTWHLSGYTPNDNLPGVTCTMSDMTFTASQITQIAATGSSSTIPVSYIVGPTKVYVVTDAGITNAADYLILDNDDMELDAMLGCKYHRVG